MADNTPLTPEEEQKLLLSMLREADPEKLEESSALEQGRARRTASQMDNPFIPGNDGQWYRAPDQPDAMGSRAEATDYQRRLKKAMAEETRREEAQRALEEALDAVLRKKPGHTGDVPYGVPLRHAPPPWPKGKK